MIKQISQAIGAYFNKFRSPILTEPARPAYARSFYYSGHISRSLSQLYTPPLGAFEPVEIYTPAFSVPSGLAGVITGVVLHEFVSGLFLVSWASLLLNGRDVNALGDIRGNIGTPGHPHEVYIPLKEVETVGWGWRCVTNFAPFPQSFSYTNPYYYPPLASFEITGYFLDKNFFADTGMEGRQ